MRKPTIITFMNDNKIDPDVVLLAKLCYANAVDYALCLYDDADFDCGTINAYVWTPDGLKREVVAFPVYAECMSCDYQMRAEISKHSKILDDFSLSKKDINDLLLSTEFASNIIPTLHTLNPVGILSYAGMFSEIIVKPLLGARGEGIVCIKQVGEEYHFTLVDNSHITLDYENSISKLQQLFHGYTVIVQPRMNFRSKSGGMMDFRLNVAKGGDGKWRKVFVVARTSRDSIVSNLNSGGYATDGGTALLSEFEDDALVLRDKMLKIANEVPPIVEDASKCHMLSLGIDVAIDRDTLNPYIIEVNYVPQVHFYKDAYNSTKADYFRYLTKQLADS